MRRMKIALLGMLAVFIASGIATSSASATGGPFWHVNGSKLSQGTKQLNLQLKTSPAVLKGEIVLLPAVIECTSSSSEGATIEGSGPQKPGQGKGKLKFTGCTVKLNNNGTVCKVVEPIETNQSKARLVTFAGTQTKYGVLFEPQQSNTFAIVTLENQGTNKCPAGNPEKFAVQGTQAAELLPPEQETKEGLLVFPATPISKAFWWGNEQLTQPEEVKVGLTLGGRVSSFSAVYGGSLATGEPFGVFGT